MHKFLLAFFIVISSLSKAQDIDVLHYKFALRLNNSNDSINGYAEITFLLKQHAKDISFDLSSIKPNGKGMKAFNVQLMQPSKQAIPFVHANDKVTLSSSVLKKGDSSVIAIWYKGIPGDGLIISKNKHGDRTFFSDNWPNRARNWIPCNDRPDDKASFEFVVETPQDYEVIANGLLTTKPITNEGKTITHWKEDTPLSTKVMAIGVARFATKTFESSPTGIPVSAWVYPQDSTKGFYDYALTPEILNFFSDYIAPFPYKKLANVQSKTVFGGMENASAIFYAENSVTGDRSKEDLMAHEIAHQWFGDMASEKSFAHVWLSEGFATFLTNYYLEKKYGKQAANVRWRNQRDEVIAFTKRSLKPVVDSTADLMSLLNANSYEKGAWFLHMLRNEVGDKTFQTIIQAYYNQFKRSNAETRDFEAIVEKISGKELTWFFNQWLYKPGVPVLQMNTAVHDNQFVLNIKQEGIPYRLTLEVQLTVKDGELIKQRFEISKKEESFIVPINGSSAQFSIDPDTKLLYKLKN